MSSDVKVFAADPVEIATEKRRQAVREAVGLLRSGGAHIDPHLRALHFEMALDTLIKSVQKCARLDNRPLDAERVYTRHLQVMALLYEASRDGVA